ncbi:FAD-dependent monooxygenase [Actinomadura sp. 7K507]|uniref:FAD-dependent monooxygenase n=1 Tax=Actinomadura sp. 7K507 TaxID=2530365 RepID=UPI00104C564B|nr:FAD-dependent monooxygenase [Actinomadura sp. 7K507]TDC76150.1 monooxygenase [Actinomadura sp. 7K507]
MPHAIVIGAGIGGLTAAAALHGHGWDVHLHERATSLEPAGSGLAIGPNALRALDTVGAGDPVRDLAAIQGDGGVRRPDGSWLSRTSAEAAAARYGDPIVALLRSTLATVLTARLPEGALHLGSHVTSVSPAGTVTAGGTEHHADLVVAADGIRSGVRSALFPGHRPVRYTGLTAWRGVVDDPVPGVTPGEAWGRGQVFGMTPLAGGRTYFYATARAPQGARAAGDAAERDGLRRLFAGWHDPIPALLDAVPPSALLRNDVHDLPAPLKAFHRGNVALLGDAAHPMTPNLGQGACQAIEDAVVLAHEVTAGGGPPAYTAARVPRTTAVMRRSHQIARMTALSGAAPVAVRDGLMRLAGALGPTAVLRQADMLYRWHPPTAPSPR